VGFAEKMARIVSQRENTRIAYQWWAGKIRRIVCAVRSRVERRFASRRFQTNAAPDPWRRQYRSSVQNEIDKKTNQGHLVSGDTKVLELHVPDASAWNFDAGIATHPRLDALPTRASIGGGGSGGGGGGGSIVDTEKFEHIQMECENQTGEVARVKGSRGGRFDAGICVENVDNVDRGR
jgi:hypothetical protein